MTEPVRPEDMRVSDIERSAVQKRLNLAHDAGQLDLTEFDDRLRAVWAARTRAELARTTADLPEPQPVPRPPGARPAERRPVFSDTAGGTTMRVLTIVLLSIVAVNVAVWGIVSATNLQLIYPWWLWVGAPPAAVLAVLYAAGIGRPDRS